MQLRVQWIYDGRGIQILYPIYRHVCLCPICSQPIRAREVSARLRFAIGIGKINELGLFHLKLWGGRDVGGQDPPS